MAHGKWLMANACADSSHPLSAISHREHVMFPISTFADHLWQSTLVAALAGLLTLAFRNNRAQVRYWLWLAASLKFLIPFTALTALGHQVGWRSPVTLVQPQMTFFVDAVTQPFSQPVSLVVAVSTAAASPGVAAALTIALAAIWLGGCAVILLTWCVRWRRVGMAVRQAAPVSDGRALAALRRLERRGGITRPIALVSSDSPLEPGVFGILRPVLFWPRGIGAHLGDAQVEAILAHELSHVRRRDNLAAALHMIVEVVFWLHPLVWWVGARLVDERERACDEEVIRLGSEPQVYAESILKTCEFCLEPGLLCVAGVTGSDLKKRIEAISIWDRMEDAEAYDRTGYKDVVKLLATVVDGTPKVETMEMAGTIHKVR
jgi:beta-lactamase regulating signal transducer with metallopeptidase domain